jgi:hypothetical protein
MRQEVVFNVDVDIRPYVPHSQMSKEELLAEVEGLLWVQRRDHDQIQSLYKEIETVPLIVRKFFRLFS